MRSVYVGIGGLISGFLAVVAWFALFAVVMFILDRSDSANRDGTTIEQYVVLCQLWLFLTPVALLIGCWTGGRAVGNRWDDTAG